MRFEASIKRFPAYKLEVSDSGPSDLTMKSSLGVIPAQSRIFLTPAVWSIVSVLRMRAEKSHRFIRPRVFWLRRNLLLGHTAERVGSCTDDKRAYSGDGRHWIEIMPRDSSDTQCLRGDDHRKDEAGEEDGVTVQSPRTDGVGHVDEAIQSIVRHERPSEHADSVTGQGLPPLKDGRVEELARLAESPSQSFLSVLEQQEATLSQRETLSRSRESTHAVMNQPATESRMRSRKGTQRPRTKGILTGSAGGRRENVKSPEVKLDKRGCTEEDERYMAEALVEANKAATAGEVPVGAVIVQKGKIIARAYNRVESEGDPTAHAEMLCMRNAAKHHGDWRLMDATLYVTLEPCPMCAGAILQSRVKELVWGTRNTLLGADGSWVSLFPELVEEEKDGESPKEESESCKRPRIHPFHTSLEVRREVLADDCSRIMQSFFQARRKDRVSHIKTKPWWLPLIAWVLFRRLLYWFSSLARV